MEDKKKVKLSPVENRDYKTVKQRNIILLKTLIYINFTYFYKSSKFNIRYIKMFNKI